MRRISVLALYLILVFAVGLVVWLNLISQANAVIVNLDPNESIQVATLRGDGAAERSIRYVELMCLEWHSNSVAMMSKAADLVQRWVLTRKMPRTVSWLKLGFRCAEKNVARGEEHGQS